MVAEKGDNHYLFPSNLPVLPSFSPCTPQFLFSYWRYIRRNSLLHETWYDYRSMNGEGGIYFFISAIKTQPRYTTIDFSGVKNLARM